MLKNYETIQIYIYFFNYYINYFFFKFLRKELEKVKSQIQVLYIGKKSIIEYPPSTKK